MAPSKKSKAPAKKPQKAAVGKVAAKSASSKSAPKRSAGISPQPAVRQPAVAVYAASPKPVKPVPVSPMASTLAFNGKVWWAFAWRQYAIGFIFNAVASLVLLSLVAAVGSIRFQVWMLTMEMEYPWTIEVVNLLSGLLLSLLAAWLAVHFVVKRGAARKFKTFSLAHHKPDGTPAVGFRAQLPLAVALWWRQTLLSVVYMSAAVAFFAFTTQGGEYLTWPEKVYIALVLVFFVLMNIAIIDRLVSKRHFKWFSLVVEPRTDKQA